MDQAALLAYARSIPISGYFDVVAFTVFFYDYILTFDMELQHVWGAPWNIGKVAFLLIRYMPFEDLPATFYHRFSPYITPDGCRNVYQWTSWSFSLSTCVSDIILAFRTWAIWDKSRTCAILLFLVFACCYIPAFVTVGIFSTSLEFETQPTPAIVGCLAVKASNLLAVSYAVMMIYQFIIFTATLARGVHLYRQMHMLSSLVKTLYWDALIFSTYLFAVYFANIIVIMTAFSEYAMLLSSFHRVITSVLVGRILLHLRREAARDPAAELETTVIDLRPPTVISGASRLHIVSVQDEFELDHVDKLT